MPEGSPLNRQENSRAVMYVRGNVQGVFFRANARTEAERLMISGFAENQADGSVLVVAEGTRPALEAFIAWCGKGSPFASVESCTVQWQAASGSFGDFTIR